MHPLVIASAVLMAVSVSAAIAATPGGLRTRWWRALAFAVCLTHFLFVTYFWVMGHLPTTSYDFRDLLLVVGIWYFGGGAVIGIRQWRLARAARRAAGRGGAERGESGSGAR